jgi:hypothetical protein
MLAAVGLVELMLIRPINCKRYQYFGRRVIIPYQDDLRYARRAYQNKNVLRNVFLKTDYC